jgi:large conductance mechanosensitive channel
MSERAVTPIRMRRPAWIDEFQAFIMRGNVIDLAVGIIIGVAFTTVVNSLVKDIFTPVIGLIVGGIDFSNIFITLKGPSAATLADAQKAGAVTLNVGIFINTVIQFLIVSFAVFWLIKVLTRLRLRRAATPAPPPPPPRSEVLLEEIRDLLAEKHPSVVQITTEAQRT